MFIATMVLFTIFITFQILYIFIPVFSVKDKEGFKKLPVQKPISVLIPAYNEETVILNCLQGLLSVDYKNFEVILINDGSTDSTLELLSDYLHLEVTTRQKANIILHETVKAIYQAKHYPHIYVIDKQNGGKADALNAGTEFAANDIVITLDADSVLEANALHAINSAFEDERVLAAGGMVQVGQGFHSSELRPQFTFALSGITRYQIIHYLTAFYLHKLTQAKINSITVIAGAFGAFRKYALLEVCGYRKTVGEDMDITLKMQQLIATKYKKHKLIFVPSAICYTECPTTFKDLFSQRIRWQKAFIDCILHYWTSFFRKMKTAPSLYLLLDSFLLGTLNAFIMLHIPISFALNPDNYMIPLGLFTMTFFLASYQSITALLISRRFGLNYSKPDYARMALFIPIEIVTYRLLGLLFVITGTMIYFKNKEGWNVSRRSGTNYQIEGLENPFNGGYNEKTGS